MIPAAPAAGTDPRRGAGDGPVPALPAHIARLELPTPYPVGPVNAYVVLGRPVTLIDVGPNTDDAEAALLDGLRALGLAPADIGQVIITHPHVDHHGGLDRFRRWHPAVRVAAHMGAGLFFGGAPRARLEFYRQWLAQTGLPAPGVEAALEGLRRLGDLEPQAPADVWLQDGDLVAMGGGTWRVLHTPGHAGAQICLYHEPTGVMFTADHVLPAVSSNAIIEPPPVPGASRPRTLVQYLDALRRVAALPVGLALPGHGQPFADLRALVHQRLAMHRERLQRLLTLLEDGPATVFDLAQAMFGAVGGQQLVLALSEVQGHLDVLEALEQVAAGPAGLRGDGAVLVYQRRPDAPPLLDGGAAGHK
ncbi:MAG TPA: MBL fold metallo-hydrolase [Limnochordales bacterium]|nr:MBL fold metallo-hydrolase [Limnochordales bacterium]